MYRNKTAVNNERIGKPFDPKASKAQGRQPFVQQHKITKVTPQMVAYAALQVFPNHSLGSNFDPSLLQTYIGLSTAAWGEKDGTFSLIHFYHLIVKTLSNDEDQWALDTLAWWQRYVLLYYAFDLHPLNRYSTGSCSVMALPIQQSQARGCV
jgi:hypothetical protein